MLTFIGIFAGAATLVGFRFWGRRRAAKRLSRQIILALEQPGKGNLEGLFVNPVDRAQGLGLLGGLVLLIGYGFLEIDMGARVIGFILTVVVGAFTILEKSSDWDHLKKLEAAAHALEQLKLEGRPAQVEALFEFLLLQKMNPEFVSVAMNALEGWKPTELPISLDRYSEDDLYEFDQRVRSLDSTSDQLIQQLDSGQLETVIELLDESQYWSRIYKEIQSTGTISKDWKLTVEQQPAVEFLMRNLGFSQKVPKVICTRCFARAEVTSKYRFVRCKHCHEADALIGNVNMIKGEVGGEKSGKQESGEFIVQLWDEEFQQARPAEVGGLEIVAGAPINYDWAISACLEALNNSFPNLNLKPSLVVQPGVELNANTRLQLEAFLGKKRLALRPAEN